MTIDDGGDDDDNDDEIDDDNSEATNVKALLLILNIWMFVNVMVCVFQRGLPA